MTGSCKAIYRMCHIQKTHFKDRLKNPNTTEPAEHGNGGEGVLLHDVHLPPPRPPLRLLPLLLDLILSVVWTLEHPILGSLLEQVGCLFVSPSFAYLHLAPLTRALTLKGSLMPI